MKYVLDASVAIRWELPNALTPKALRLREDFRNQIHDLIAPSNYLGEVASALTKAERQKLIQLGQSIGLIQKTLKISEWIRLYFYPGREARKHATQPLRTQMPLT